MPAGEAADLSRGVASASVHGHGAQPLGQGQPAGVQVDGEDGQRAESARQLNGRHAQPASAENGHALAGGQPALAQGVQRGGRGAHHGRAVREGYLVWQRKDAAGRHSDEFGVAAVAVFADHLAAGAELLLAALAIGALAARCQVVQAHALAHLQARHPLAHRLHQARHLVAQGQGQWPGRRDAGPIVRVRVADAGRSDAHQHIIRPNRRNGRSLQLQRLADRDQPHGLHELNHKRLRKRSAEPATVPGAGWSR